MNTIFGLRVIEADKCQCVQSYFQLAMCVEELDGCVTEMWVSAWLFFSQFAFDEHGSSFKLLIQGDIEKSTGNLSMFY